MYEAVKMGRGGRRRRSAGSPWARGPRFGTRPDASRRDPLLVFSGSAPLLDFPRPFSIFFLAFFLVTPPLPLPLTTLQFFPIRAHPDHLSYFSPLFFTFFFFFFFFFFGSQHTENKNKVYIIIIAMCSRSTPSPPVSPAATTKRRRFRRFSRFRIDISRNLQPPPLPSLPAASLTTLVHHRQPALSQAVAVPPNATLRLSVPPSLDRRARFIPSSPTSTPPPPHRVVLSQSLRPRRRSAATVAAAHRLWATC